MDKKELIEQYKNCKSKEERKELLNKYNGELSQEELDIVSGGGCLDSGEDAGATPKFCVGQVVEWGVTKSYDFCVINAVSSKTKDKDGYNTYLYTVENLHIASRSPYVLTRSGDIQSEVSEYLLVETKDSYTFLG